MSELERTSLTLDKIIQFIHLVLHNYMLWCSFLWGLRNWLHNKAVARKKCLGGGGLVPAHYSFARSSLCTVMVIANLVHGGGPGGGGGAFAFLAPVTTALHKIGGHMYIMAAYIIMYVEAICNYTWRG